LEPDRLAALEADPSTAGALDLLREAEQYLWATSPLSTLPCLDANELYDYGRGPGYQPMATGRRFELETHLEHCGDCRELKDTLASPPPMPLVLEKVAPAPASPPPGTPWPLREDAEQHGTSSLSARLLRHPRLGPRRKPRAWNPKGLFRLIPVGAALLILAFGMSIFQDPVFPTVYAPDGLGGYPLGPLLRGTGVSSQAPLLFPRGRLLAPTDTVGPAWLQATAPVFEITPVEDASEYRVLLERLSSDAFAEGNVVERLAGPGPLLAASAALAPGDYRWEATALVRGLPRELGAMDFQVLENDALIEQLIALDGDPRRGIHAVQLLHSKGFQSDARALARQLPASRGRDVYLGQQPAR
jgi:hypothetical protein